MRETSRHRLWALGWQYISTLWQLHNKNRRYLEHSKSILELCKMLDPLTYMEYRLTTRTRRRNFTRPSFMWPVHLYLGRSIFLLPVAIISNINSRRLLRTIIFSFNYLKCIFRDWNSSPGVSTCKNMWIILNYSSLALANRNFCKYLKFSMYRFRSNPTCDDVTRSWSQTVQLVGSKEEIDKQTFLGEIWKTTIRKTKKGMVKKLKCQPSWIQIYL